MTVHEIEQVLEAPGPVPRAGLMEIWEGRDAEAWAGRPQLYRLLAERILRLAEPLVAYDVVKEGLEHAPGDLRLRQLRALALARSGAGAEAQAELVHLRDEGHADEDTLGILGGRYKEAALQSGSREEALRLVRLAYEAYSDHRVSEPGPYRKINAATMAAILGERETAQRLAREVRSTCLQELKQVDEEGRSAYWLLASLGEAALILEERSEAEGWYGKAAEAAQGNYGDVSTTRRNMRLLARHLGADAGPLERVLRVPRVVLFAGHMVDRPGRAVPRFPARLEPAVRAAIHERLRALDAGFGFASAACGSDVLFHEALLELGGKVEVVLPYTLEAFVRDSVDIVPGTDWRARCEGVMKRAESWQEASGHRLSGGAASFEYSNLLLQGLALLRAEQLETELVALAVWDAKPGDGPGGTASAVERWRGLDLRVEVIDLGEILRREAPEMAAADGAPARREAPAEAPQAFTPEIRALLFGDAVGFSKLTDEEVPRFVEHFLGMVGSLTRESPHAPLVKNTWGDGLYLVFKDVRDAGRFALDLCAGIRETDWARKGLGDLSLRIGLHAGPVYACVDPVTQTRNYIGAHVSRAARIEPVTPPGQVYASQPFAALAAATLVREFRCDYVGRTSLAKKYGVFPTYLVRPRPS